MSRQTRTCAKCPKAIYSDNQTGLCRTCLNGLAHGVSPDADPAAAVVADREQQQERSRFLDLKKKYEESLRIIDRQNITLGWLDEIRKGVDSTFHIEPKERGLSTNEATPIIVCSDWHSEEIVKPAQVNGLNDFNPDVEERRVTRLFQASLNLIKNHLNPGVSINTVVLALLGDFITNDIHDAENAESNAMTPVFALMRVQDQILKGIEFLLNNSPYDFIIPCKVGNHSRTTKKVRSASEVGHSLETLMYAYLASNFKNEPRVKFVIDDGYHTYLTVYGKVIRFHHGHALQYQGGIGGLFIPAYKAVSQWDKGRRADLDIFGHFHQTKDGGKFLCNGSLIGYNSFALRIKADYEPPQQTLLLVDKKRGRTCTWPILLEKS